MKAKLIRVTALILTVILSCAMLLPVTADTIPGYTDVSDDAWYADAVLYVTGHGLMEGTSEGVFSPKTTFTRAMSVLVLARVAGVSLDGYTTTRFADVKDGRWYTAAIAWADENGIANGSGGVFGYADAVTREQLAVMIYKFAGLYRLHNDYPEGAADLSGFTDTASVHSWAEEALLWSVRNGLISGTDEGQLNPRGTATRAEAAQMFYNLDYMKSHRFLPPVTADADALEIMQSSENRVICWGDSLTAGYGAETTPYPEALASLMNIPVLNDGISSETSELIAMRQGGIPVFALPMTIPADTTPVMLDLVTEDGNTAEIGTFGMAGVNKMVISGVSGVMSYDKAKNTFYFTRDEAGEEVVLTRLTQVVTQGMAQRQSSDIQIIFIGSNNKYNLAGIGSLLEIQEQMIAYSGTDEYIIVGFTAIPMMPEIAKLNSRLAEVYGDKFLDIREYFLTDALADAGITPTAQDLEDIANGQIPASLRSDPLHGNDIFYNLFARQVQKKINELGYLD